MFWPFATAMVAIAALVGLPILTWILFRLLAHRERMEMIRRGYATSPPTYPKREVERGLRYAYEPDNVADVQLRRGVTTSFIGFALLVGLSFIGFHDDEFVLGPWLLGGLVPLFAGLAQVVNALLNGAHFGTAGNRFGPRAADQGGPPTLIVPQTESESEKRPPV